MGYKLLVLLCFVSLCASACKFGSEPASDVKHELGQTSVTPTQALTDCSKEPDRDSARFPIATAYIKKIAHHIMSANPSTFSGAFSADKFCFRIADDKEFNAYAFPSSGAVTFHTSTLASLTSDGNVAAIMAHELAHITMQHVTNVPITHSDFKKVEMQIPSNSSGLIKQKNAEIETLKATYESSARQTNALLEQLSKASEKDAEAVRSIFALESILKQNTYIKDSSPSQWQKYADDLNKYYLQIMGGADAEAGVASAYKLRELAELEASLVIQLKFILGCQSPSATRYFVPEDLMSRTRRLHCSKTRSDARTTLTRPGRKKCYFLTVPTQRISAGSWRCISNPTHRNRL